jgi:hypothetical protein
MLSNLMAFLRAILCNLLVLSALRADLCSVSTTMLPIDSGSGKAQLSLQLGKTRSRLHLAAQGLAAGAEHELWVDGVWEGGFFSRDDGTGELDLSPWLERSLDFDPRGKKVELRVGSQTVLSTRCWTTGESSGSSGAEAVTLRPVGAEGTAALSYTQTAEGLRTLSVAVSGVGAGELKVFLNGRALGAIQPTQGSGTLLLSSRQMPKPWLLLEQDPRGALVDILRGQQVLFTGQILARGLGVSLAKEDHVWELPIPAIKASQGRVRARFISTQQAKRQLSISLQGLAPGSYRLFINGKHRADLPTGNGRQRFTNYPDQGAEVLDFDPAGAAIVVHDGAGPVFQGTLDPGKLLGLPGSEPAFQLTETLAAMPEISARAEASYGVDATGRHSFSVSLSRATEGVFNLRVGGLVQQVIRCAASGEGSASFSSSLDQGKALLDFDPRGQLLEIVDLKGLVWFSHLLGSGSADHPAIAPVDETWALFPEGSSKGFVVVRHLVVMGEQQLRLAANALEPGSYELRVAGRSFGSCQAAEGSITQEWQSLPDPGDLLLSSTVAFPIELWKEGQLLFRR